MGPLLEMLRLRLSPWEEGAPWGVPRTDTQGLRYFLSGRPEGWAAGWEMARRGRGAEDSIPEMPAHSTAQDSEVLGGTLC